MARGRGLRLQPRVGRHIVRLRRSSLGLPSRRRAALCYGAFGLAPVMMDLGAAISRVRASVEVVARVRRGGNAVDGRSLSSVRRWREAAVAARCSLPRGFFFSPRPCRSASLLPSLKVFRCAGRQRAVGWCCGVGGSSTRFQQGDDALRSRVRASEAAGRRERSPIGDRPFYTIAPRQAGGAARRRQHDGLDQSRCPTEVVDIVRAARRRRSAVARRRRGRGAPLRSRGAVVAAGHASRSRRTRAVRNVSSSSATAAIVQES